MKTRGLIGTTDLCAASGALPSQVEFWCRLGIIVPAKASTGRGDHRQFNDENILEATQAAELVRAGCGTKQLNRIFEEQHRRLTGLPSAARLVLRFKMYIGTIKLLAELFGRGPGYDEWLATQMRQLRRMEHDLARLGVSGGPDLDERLLRTLLRNPARETQALADV